VVTGQEVEKRSAYHFVVAKMMGGWDGHTGERDFVSWHFFLVKGKFTVIQGYRAQKEI